MANLYYKSGDEWLPLGGGSLPVGSYVYSDNNVSPAADMGGTWQSLGYTAVEPVVLWNAPGYSVSSVENLYGSIYRHYNYIHGELFQYSAFGGVSLRLISPSLPKTNLFDGHLLLWGWENDERGVHSCTTQSYQSYPTLYDDTNVLQLSYTTNDPLNPSISGGKYLFKRTA